MAVMVAMAVMTVMPAIVVIGKMVVEIAIPVAHSTVAISVAILVSPGTRVADFAAVVMIAIRPREGGLRREKRHKRSG